MIKRWFLSHNGLVKGPLSDKEIEAGVNSGSVDRSSQVWWKGGRDWISLSDWQKRKDEIVAALTQSKDTRQWHFMEGVDTVGPVSTDQLIQKLATKENPGDVMIWSQGFDQWLPVYGVEEITKALNLPPRRSPRADVVSQGTGETSEHQQFKLTLTSLSFGGAGIVTEEELIPGQEITLTLEGGDLPTAIHATAEVVFVGKNGFKGLRFKLLTSEAENTIVDIIKSKTGYRAA